LGFPDGHWWQFLLKLSERFGSCATYIGPFGEGPTDILVDWKIIFVIEGKRLGIVARDMINSGEIWLKGAQKNLEEFAGDARLARVILVARRAHPAAGAGEGYEAPFPIVVSDLAPTAADSALELLRK
jgi:hypothetical protein